MKVLRVTIPRTLEIQEEPIPKIDKSDDVLIQVRAAGICGSDISIYQGTSPVATYPRVIGHEFAGIVKETGADVWDINPGDHVTVNPVCSCKTCRICLKGRENVCANLKVIGVHTDGGYRQYVKIPAENVFKIKDNIPWEQAAIIEPYTVAAQVTSRGGVTKGDTVLICGSGQIALTILQVCTILGAKCIMTDIIDERLSRAKSYGAWEVINSDKEDVVLKIKELTGGYGTDIAIDAACVGKTLEQAADSVRAGGVVVTMGFHNTTAPVTEFNITSRELDIRGSRLNNQKFPQVIEWVESGQIDLSKIITDVYTYTDVEKAFQKIGNDPENTLKVILTFPNTDSKLEDNE